MHEQFKANEPGLTIAPIEMSQGQLVRSAIDLKQLVEAPALPACVDLYDKNIRTVSASANCKDTERAYIDIDYASLSDENKAIALTVGEPIVYAPNKDLSAPDAIKLAIPLEPGDGVETVSAKLSGLAERFQIQPLTWAPVYNLEQLKSVYGYLSDEQVSPDDFAPEGYYYDEPSGLFYLSEELFQKQTGSVGLADNAPPNII